MLVSLEAKDLLYMLVSGGHLDAKRHRRASREAVVLVEVDGFVG